MLSGVNSDESSIRGSNSLRVDPWRLGLVSVFSQLRSHRRFSVALFFATCLVACGRVDLEDTAKSFAENKDSFTRLRSMIQEDTVGESCFSVGTDHIGDYWEHDNRWNTNQNYQRKITLDQVLEEVGIAKARYQEYLSLFEKTGSERIDFCPRKPSWIRIMVHRSGLAVSGCLTTININDDRSIPSSNAKPGYSSEIKPLGDGWYLNHDCT